MSSTETFNSAATKKQDIMKSESVLPHFIKSKIMLNNSALSGYTQIVVLNKSYWYVTVNYTNHTNQYVCNLLIFKDGIVITGMPI